MNSILQNKKECYICGLYNPIEEHHIYFGTNRKISEKNGFKVWLCIEHHRGTIGVHGKLGHSLDLRLKQECERKFINQGHSIEDFIKIIGKSYI